MTSYSPEEAQKFAEALVADAKPKPASVSLTATEVLRTEYNLDGVRALLKNIVQNQQAMEALMPADYAVTAEIIKKTDAILRAMQTDVARAAREFSEATAAFANSALLQFAATSERPGLLKQIADLTEESGGTEVTTVSLTIGVFLDGVIEFVKAADAEIASAIVDKTKTEDVVVGYMVIGLSKIQFQRNMPMDFLATRVGRMQLALFQILTYYKVNNMQEASLARVGNSYRLSATANEEAVLAAFAADASTIWPDVSAWKSTGDRGARLRQLWNNFMDAMDIQEIQRIVGNERTYACPLSRAEKLLLCMLGRAVHGVQFSTRVTAMPQDDETRGVTPPPGMNKVVSLELVPDLTLPTADGQRLPPAIAGAPSGMNGHLETYVTGLVLFGTAMLQHASNPDANPRLFNGMRVQSLVRALALESGAANASSESQILNMAALESGAANAPSQSQRLNMEAMGAVADVIADACVRQMTGTFEALMDRLTDGDYSRDWPEVLHGVRLRPTAEQRRQMLSGVGDFQTDAATRSQSRPDEEEAASVGDFDFMLKRVLGRRQSDIRSRGYGLSNAPLHYLLFEACRHNIQLNNDEMKAVQSRLSDRTQSANASDLYTYTLVDKGPLTQRSP